jgi:hypothetical protein
VRRMPERARSSAELATGSGRSWLARGHHAVVGTERPDSGRHDVTAAPRSMRCVAALPTQPREGGMVVVVIDAVP